MVRIAAVLVGVVAIGAFLVWIAASQPEAIPDGVPEGAQAFGAPSRNHVEGPIEYDVQPPPGGDHNPVWLNCGVYREPVPVENAVHALEHAAVWITYRPDLDADSIGELEGYGRDRRKVIVSPFPGQESPIILTSWGWQLALDDVADLRLRQYLQEFEGTGYAPEPGAVCSGGVGSPA